MRAAGRATSIRSRQYTASAASECNACTVCYFESHLQLLCPSTRLPRTRVGHSSIAHLCLAPAELRTGPQRGRSMLSWLRAPWARYSAPCSPKQGAAHTCAPSAVRAPQSACMHSHGTQLDTQCCACKLTQVQIMQLRWSAFPDKASWCRTLAQRACWGAGCVRPGLGSAWLVLQAVSGQHQLQGHFATGTQQGCDQAAIAAAHGRRTAHASDHMHKQQHDQVLPTCTHAD